jgi:hypothetical protein
MSDGLLVFGDIIKYNDESYIFLASTSDQLYTAKILAFDLSHKITEAYKHALTKNKEIKLRNLLYCFVILTTQQFEKRIAHLAKTESQFEKGLTKTNFKLNKKDLISLKEEILISRGVPIILKELVSKLDIK